jgi:hypothetical protein
VHTEAVPLENAPERELSAVAPEQVTLYESPEQVPGKYEELALVTSASVGAGAGEEELLWSLREKASQIGANAIIVQESDGPGAERHGIAIFVHPKREEAPPPKEKKKKDDGKKEPWARSLAGGLPLAQG